MKNCRYSTNLKKGRLTTIVLFGTFVSFGQLTFSEISSEESGIKFQNNLRESPQINVLTYQYFHNGGGVAVGDLNNDGLPDIYFTSNLEPNRLYLNEGNFKFTEISSTAKVSGGRGWATGSCMIDINNDGFLDIYVCKSGNTTDEARKNKLYINQGDLTFVESAAAYGLDDLGYSSQAYFLDFDKDGDLDMYLLNHSIKPLQANTSNIDLSFERDPLAGDKFFRNDNGKFIDISDTAGIKGSPLGFGLSASIGDVNGDGYPDVYVCNDYLERDYLYINNGNGTFTDRLKENTGHISNFSMGSDIADINNDGHLDIMVADMAAEDNYRSKTNMSGMNPERFWNFVNNGFHYQYMINTLQLNRGDGSFSEISQLAGIDKTDWSWAPLFADFNQDGLKDLFVTNGLRKEARNNDFVKKKKILLARMKEFPDSTNFYLKEILDEMPEEPISNYLYTNKGDLHFSKIGNTGMSNPTFSNGAAYADLDGDGDLDLIVNNIDNVATIYRNDSETDNYIKIKLAGDRGNVSGIGAKLTIVCGNLVQTTEHYLSRGYLSSVEDLIHFGLGKNRIIDKVEVVWSNGTVTLLENIEINQVLAIEQNGIVNTDQTNFRTTLELNTELQQIDYKHTENDFDDFEREVLLPHKMSNLGPAIAVADVNGDGLDDFYVGGASGQSGQLFIQSANGEFRKEQDYALSSNASREEVVAHFFDADGDNDLDLYIGSGGNEFLNGADDLKDQLYLNENGSFVLSNALPKDMSTSTGTIISTDFDGDGDLDLFVGSRQTPGKYPFASKSYILKNENGQFTDITDEIAPVLNELGMITDVVWADLNNNGNLELALSGEWMPLTILEIEDGVYIDRTTEFGLKNSNGWWFSLESADIDNDGDLDLIAGNLGLNYKYKASLDGPFQIYSEDINKDGMNDIVLGYDQGGEIYPLRGRQCSSEQIPELQQDFPTYDLFASATLNEVYGDRLNPALKLEVFDFHSAVFINNDGKFRRQNFAHRFQSFNWNDIITTDLNSDGNIDIICAGNLFEAEVETPRCDAGKGLILLGDGRGNWQEIQTSNNKWGIGNVKQLQLLVVNGNKSILIGENNKPLKLLNFLSK